MLETLSQEEIGILFATKYSENAQTAAQLATWAETYEVCAQRTIDLLVEKGIFEPYEQEWDDTTRYTYADNSRAQAVYDEIYGPLEQDHRFL